MILFPQDVLLEMDTCRTKLVQAVRFKKTDGVEPKIFAIEKLKDEAKSVASHTGGYIGTGAGVF